jgi:hypothetical protein
MTEGDYANYPTTTKPGIFRGKTMYRKSSSRLSEGTIACVVIAYTISLIIIRLLLKHHSKIKLQP